MIHEVAAFKKKLSSRSGKIFITLLMIHFMLPAEEIGSLHEWLQLADKQDRHPERL